MKRQYQVKILRVFRKIHRTTGALLFVFFFIVAITGLLLGWKKNSGGYLLANTQKGTTADLKQWLPIDSLYQIACREIQKIPGEKLSLALDRIDIRKEKGTVKFIFSEHFSALQLDGATGKLLQLEKRRSDFVEKIHDGSIIDFYLGTDGTVKLIYTSIMGLALLLFTITGFWLWYGPKVLKKR